MQRPQELAEEGQPALKQAGRCLEGDEQEPRVIDFRLGLGDYFADKKS